MGSTGDVAVKLSSNLLKALKPWTEDATWDEPQYFRSPYQLTQIWTDASREGWGALNEQGDTATGLWSSQEKEKHINTLELLAVQKAIVKFHLAERHVRVHTDSDVTKFIINKKTARSPALIKQLTELLQVARVLQVHITAARIPTELNVVADGLSRIKPLTTEWRLPKEVFEELQGWTGTIEVDLMATPNNKQVERFVAPFDHPRALFTDALSRNWKGLGRSYVFPPPNLIPQLIPRITEPQTETIMVTPWLPQQPWFPILAQHATRTKRLTAEVFQETATGTAIHPLRTSGAWIAFHFCKNT